MSTSGTGMWGYEVTAAVVDALYPGKRWDDQEVLLAQSLPNVKYADYILNGNRFFLWCETAQTFPFEVSCFKEGN